MPGLVETRDGGASAFKTFTVKELHPKQPFGAEIEGVNFPTPSEEQFNEILAAMAKVCMLLECLLS
jgi:alpha-ketoglutarate-dependent 2,4-dichlorophenoxyacetate dioxygenase